MANIVNFSEKQFEDRLEKNIERLTKNRLAVDEPTAFLLSGQPGSGKTSLRSVIDHHSGILDRVRARWDRRSRVDLGIPSHRRTGPGARGTGADPGRRGPARRPAHRVSHLLLAVPLYRPS